jgi:flagellar basal-body rod modification protein FlgD
MTTLDSISAASTQARASGTAPRRDELDQDAFLKLMIAQLQNQDPFKPLDPTEYVGQLAQFSTVSGLQSIETSIANLTDSMRGNQVLDGAALVGRSVLAEGDIVRLQVSSPMSDARGVVEVPAGVTDVRLVVRDSAGQLVRTAQLDASAGTREFRWDGRTNAGAAAAAGDYQVGVVAQLDGRNVSLPTQVSARVTSVSIDPRTNSLTVNTDTLGELPLAQVRRVM